MRVFDGHCDTISQLNRMGGSLAKREGHLDLEQMDTFEGWAQFFASFASMKRATKPMWEIFQDQYNVFCRQMEENKGRIVQCRTAAEAEAAWAAGKHAAFLSVEGAELLDCDINKLEQAYAMGVRAVNLTWNHENILSGTNVESPEKGLSAQGKAFALRMQELGMLVDVSHISDPAFWDLIELAKKPIFASHSNSRAICPHTRNLTDEMFQALIKNGGVAGLNMCAEFVGEDPDIDTLVAHVEHWFALGGEDTVAMGGDWDGIRSAPKGIDGIRDLHKLADRLLQMNYPEAKVNGIFYENMMRVVREVCTM